MTSSTTFAGKNVAIAAIFGAGTVGFVAKATA